MRYLPLISLLLIGLPFSTSSVAQTRFAATNGLYVGVSDASNRAAISALVGYRFGSHADVGLRTEVGSGTHIGPHVGLTAFLPRSAWGLHGSGMYRFRVDEPGPRSIVGSGADIEGLLLRRFERGNTTFVPSAGVYAVSSDRFESVAGGFHAGFGAAFDLGTAPRVLVVEPVYRYSVYGDRGQWGLRLFFNP